LITLLFQVCGRGQLHLTVLIENMRREGFELQIGPPQVIEKVIDGKTMEPFEEVDVTVPQDYCSSCVDILNKRKGEMMSMAPSEAGESLTQLKVSATRRTNGLFVLIAVSAVRLPS
jgi:GTP-binding protein